MAEPLPYNLTDAVKSDGFIDFYQMLGVTPDTPIDAIRTRINELYSEAQANRDHRNLNKRRDYQMMLEYLPNARTALLDEEKRAQYDAYAVQASAGAPAQTFEEFMSQLSGAPAADADRTDVLGVQDGAAAARIPPRCVRIWSTWRWQDERRKGDCASHAAPCRKHQRASNRNKPRSC